jgi:SAM-dependent methyltransferase
MTPLDAYLAGEVSAPVALMHMLLQGNTPEVAIARIEQAAQAEPRFAPLLALAHERQEGLRVLRRMVEAGAAHGPRDDADVALAECRAMFDRLARISPEASVAAYSLGEPDLLEAMTAELVDWIRVQGLLAGRPRVLDLGCGIGRLATALAPHVTAITGLDLSSAMIEEAQRRCADLPQCSFATCSGRDLAGIPDASLDLVLAVDVFPYLVEGGLELTARMIEEALRVLRPGGDLLIFNFSYRGDGADRDDVPLLAKQAGLSIRRNGTQEFALWNGTLFWLQRAPSAT